MVRAYLILASLLLVVQPAWTETLSPGKPAGAIAAQHISYGTGFIGLSIIAVVLTFALPASSTSSTATSTATTS
jgi:hypothetical protein